MKSIKSVVSHRDLSKKYIVNSRSEVSRKPVVRLSCHESASRMVRDTNRVLAGVLPG